MQVAYIEAFLHIDQLVARDNASFVAWLTRIAENGLRDAIRGLSQQKQLTHARVETPITRIPGDVARLPRVTTTTPSREVVKKDALGVGIAIQLLPDDYQTAVRLYDLEGRPIADVASAMGRSVGAVHMLRGRAHERLRHSLSSSQFFSGPA
jgi:RNA polymerase sigma factor (sigma-70 family)